MSTRGVRGAITVSANNRDEIISNTSELLKELVEINNIKLEDIASAIFSVTEDIDAEFPAVAARQLGWIYTPLMCTQEIPVKGSLPLCVRVLLTINSDMKQDEIKHVYLKEAIKLRPDLKDSQNKDLFYKS